MLSSSAFVKIIDNSGGKILKIIRVIHKGGYGKKAQIGDVILGSVQLLRNRNRLFSKVKKGDLVYGVVIKTRKNLQRKNGYFLKFFSNSVILITKQNMPLGTRIFSILPREIRLKKFAKILSLGSGFI